MKILIIVPRQKDTNRVDYDYLFPLGIGYISSVLKKTGHEIDCLNLNHRNGTVEELVNDELNKKNYDFVCTGSMTSGFHIVKKIIDAVREHGSKARTILGG